MDKDTFEQDDIVLVRDWSSEDWKEARFSHFSCNRVAVYNGGRKKGECLFPGDVTTYNQFKVPK